MHFWLIYRNFAEKSDRMGAATLTKTLTGDPAVPDSLHPQTPPTSSNTPPPAPPPNTPLATPLPTRPVTLSPTKEKGTLTGNCKLHKWPPVPQAFLGPARPCGLPFLQNNNNNNQYAFQHRLGACNDTLFAFLPT